MQIWRLFKKELKSVKKESNGGSRMKTTVYADLRQALDQGGPGVREPTYTQAFFSEHTLQRYVTRGRMNPRMWHLRLRGLPVR